jgi:two-component system, chemotaxis family, protein-glutamate methylesterase/glutaminase
VSPPARIRALVVDDSPSNRRSIADILSNASDVEVVGHAADGEEALRLVAQLKPDVVTLDLEMPKMDGFTFLRILMGRTPIPVIVISSYSQKENVFKALELGALDFVAKPERFNDPDLAGIRDELVNKVMLARNIRPRAQALPRRMLESLTGLEPRPAGVPAVPRHVVAIASSTGGPSALMEIFTRLPQGMKSAFVIAQHMPDKFTRTFAERLDRRSNAHVSEATDLDAVGEGTAFVCPGRQCMELESSAAGGLRLRVRAPDAKDRYAPSADRLLSSVARTVGRKAVGVILTGMGDDGVRGAQEILRAGGTVIAESELTAVVYGMPGAAVRANAASLSLPLPEIGDYLAKL